MTPYDRRNHAKSASAIALGVMSLVWIDCRVAAQKIPSQREAQYQGGARPVASEENGALNSKAEPDLRWYRDRQGIDRREGMVATTQPEDSSASPAVALLLSQSCFLEASFSHTDCAAIAWVAAKRAGCRSPHGCVGLEDSLTRYEKALHAKSPRARIARGLPWGPVPGWGDRDNRAWLGLRAYVLAILAGDVPDVCPRATQFGSKTLPVDAARAAKAVAEKRWVLASCSKTTRNAFYRELRP